MSLKKMTQENSFTEWKFCEKCKTISNRIRRDRIKSRNVVEGGNHELIFDTFKCPNCRTEWKVWVYDLV